MDIRVKRYSDNGESTLGLLYINNKFFCYTIEDQEQEGDKVSGETRIPEGKYVIGWREAITPLTKKYRSKFDWFDYHVEIKDVPNFTGIYIHKGNTADHSEGCIIVGSTANNNRGREGFVGESTPTYEKLYDRIKVALNNGDDVTIEIEDIG